MKIGNKRYKATGGGLLGIAIKAAKPLGVLVVAGMLLAAYSWAAADELQTYTAQAEEYEQVKAEYIASEELASYQKDENDTKMEDSDFSIYSQYSFDIVADESEQANQVVNSETETTSEEEPRTEEWTCLGMFKITAYCPCTECCGIYSDGITADGSYATEGVTVAADTSVLPFGSIIQINGEEYEVQDRGGAIQGNRIDIYFDNHETAETYGVQYHEVFVKETK